MENDNKKIFVDYEVKTYFNYLGVWIKGKKYFVSEEEFLLIQSPGESEDTIIEKLGLE